MKRLLLLLIILLVPAAFAATYTDTTDSDFLNGTLSSVNVTGNNVLLNTSGGVYVASGTFTSRVFDLGSNPTATISWNLATPAGTSILVSTRSGNNTTDFANWSAWSGSLISGSAITSPMQRYYQYRAQLISTNNTSTPVLNDVTITYTEGGTNISKDSSSANLTINTAGAYDFKVYVNDTLTITNVTARYKYGSGAYSNSSAMTSLGNAIYDLTVPNPGWSSYPDTNLTLEVTASRTNGTANDSVTSTLTELIDYTNALPVIDPISNLTLNQNATLNLTITGTDADNNTIAFTVNSTNTTNITVTTLTNTSARITWKPTVLQSGNFTFTVYANDSHGLSSRNFTVTVTDTNDAPTISGVSAITGYHGVRISLTLTAYDPDANANISFSVDPPFFTIATVVPTGNNTTAGTYNGIAAFTPANPEDGVHNLTFTVTDGIASANTSATMTINYCGDGTCQSGYESATICAADCAPKEQQQSIALLVPDRNCANTSMKVQTFNATDRFSCYYQGLVEKGLALCAPLPSVSITVYARNGSLQTSVATLSTDSNGTANFTPARAGEYKFSASKEDFSNATAIVYVRSCENDIVKKETNVTIDQPPLPPIEEKPPSDKPRQEEPGNTQQEASLLSAMMFYVVVPLLLAALLYASSVFYDVNKDTLPWLLETRIFVYEKRKEYEPQITAVKQKVGPVVRPVADSLNMLYTVTLKPLVDKLRKK